jgi:hypothetical protein
MKHLKIRSAEAVDEKLVMRVMHETHALNWEKGNPTKRRAP